MPSDSHRDDDDAPPPAGTPAPGPRRTERRALYRVVEFMRDEQGRVQEQGRVWHSDLRRVRQFGRAVADNTTGSRVVIADNSGRVVEELPLPELAHPAQGHWEGWRERALPPLPRQADRPRLKREAPTTPAAAWVKPADAGVPAAPSAAQAQPSAPTEAKAPRGAPPTLPLPLLCDDASPGSDPSDVEVLLP